MTSAARALTLLSRPYRVPARPFAVTTSDGVRLLGHRLGEGPVALVFCHGFVGWHQKPRLVGFQERLAKRFTVYAFDFRGHGFSGGASMFGALEHLDVEAVVRRAREDGFDRVVTFGGSMGGIAVVRHAALVRGVDAVVCVSTPATWDGHDSNAVRKMVWLTVTPSGRWLLQATGVRPGTWMRTESPAEVVGSIAPTSVVIVHGRDDAYFDEEQAWLLYRRANDPKRLLLASRFGHAEDGFTPTFARYIGQVIESVLGAELARDASAATAPELVAG